MIVITLGAERRTDPHGELLGRDRVGYDPSMSPLALYDAAHGAWRLDRERARAHRYALFTFQGRVVQAIEIHSVEAVDAADGQPTGRSVLHGTILAEGHPVHDRYVDHQSPLTPRQNPVGYYDAPEDHAPCMCGCGAATPAGKDFVTGHDQTALHDRVRQIGTVRQFITWFDAIHGNWPDLNVVVPHGSPDTAPHRHRLHGCAVFDVLSAVSSIRPATPDEMERLEPCTRCRSARPTADPPEAAPTMASARQQGEPPPPLSLADRWASDEMSGTRVYGSIEEYRLAKEARAEATESDERQ